MSTVTINALLWLAAAAILALIEAATFGLTTIWLALGALIAMIFTLAGTDLVWQILIFLIVSVILLVFTRPIAVKHLKIGTKKTNIQELIGSEGLVTQEIASFSTGQVKVRGQIWTAIAEQDHTIPVGKRVSIVRIEGVKLIVKDLKEE